MSVRRRVREVDCGADRRAEADRRDGDHLAVVGADLERDRLRRVQQLDAVEFGGRADPLDLAGELVDLGLDRALSVVESVPFLYCTARSRMRWSIECTSVSEPSAVCTSETRVLHVALGLVEATDLGRAAAR